MRDRKWWEDTIQAVMSQIEMGYDLYEIKHKYLIDNWNLSEQQADWVIDTAQQRLRQQQSPQQPYGNPGNPYISTTTQPPEVIAYLLANFGMEYARSGGDPRKVQLRKLSDSVIETRIADWPAYELFRKVWINMLNKAFVTFKKAYERLP